MSLRPFALLLVAASLAACASNERPPARDANPASEMAPQGRDPGRVVGATAEQDCLFAVATQLGVDPSSLTVLSSSMGENFTTVQVDVPQAQAPWICEWGGDGVSSVYYGAEG
jgi:hypothetical protein